MKKLGLIVTLSLIGAVALFFGSSTTLADSTGQAAVVQPAEALSVPAATVEAPVIDSEVGLLLREPQPMFGCGGVGCDRAFDCIEGISCPFGTVSTCVGSSRTGQCDGYCDCL